MNLSQFVLSSLCAAVVAIGAPSSALAQDFPTRSVTIIVPYVAGGTLDTIARHLGATLSEKLGKPVVIENRTGGGTVIGANAVAKAAPTATRY